MEPARRVAKRVIASRPSSGARLLQIAHNLVIDSFRRARPQASAGGNRYDHAPGGRARNPNSRNAWQSEFEQRRRLQIVLGALPLEQREAFYPVSKADLARKKSPALIPAWDKKRRNHACATTLAKVQGEIFGMSGNEKLEDANSNLSSRKRIRASPRYITSCRGRNPMRSSMHRCSRWRARPSLRNVPLTPGCLRRVRRLLSLVVAGVAYRASQQVWNDRGASGAPPPTGNVADEAKTTVVRPLLRPLPHRHRHKNPLQPRQPA